MKTHTTNYTNTFLKVADDCPIHFGEVPPINNQRKSVANQTFDLLNEAPPYTFSSDDLLFRLYALRNGIADDDMEAARERFFAKGQPCMRCSPLTKRYGWGIHFDEDAKMALIARDAPEYDAFAKREDLKQVFAMRNGKK